MTLFASFVSNTHRARAILVASVCVCTFSEWPADKLTKMKDEESWCVVVRSVASGGALLVLVLVNLNVITGRDGDKATTGSGGGGGRRQSAAQCRAILADRRARL